MEIQQLPKTDQQFNLRLSSVERLEFERAARLSHLALSTWMRVSLKACAEIEIEHARLSGPRENQT